MMYIYKFILINNYLLLMNHQFDIKPINQKFPKILSYFHNI